MGNSKFWVLLLVAGVVAVSGASAGPDARLAETIDSLTIYPDTIDSNRYYYAPGQVQVASSVNLYPGPEDRRFQATLTLSMREPGPAETLAIRSTLQERHPNAVELIALPLQRLAGALVMDSEATGSPTDRVAVPEIELVEEAWTSERWIDRTYRVDFNDEAARALEQAMDSSGASLQLGWESIADERILDLELKPTQWLQQARSSGDESVSMMLDLSNPGPFNHIFPDRPL